MLLCVVVVCCVSFGCVLLCTNKGCCLAPSFIALLANPCWLQSTKKRSRRVRRPAVRVGQVEHLLPVDQVGDDLERLGHLREQIISDHHISIEGVSEPWGGQNRIEAGARGGLCRRKREREREREPKSRRRKARRRLQGAPCPSCSARAAGRRRGRPRRPWRRGPRGRAPRRRACLCFRGRERNKKTCQQAAAPAAISGIKSSGSREHRRAPSDTADPSPATGPPAVATLTPAAPRGPAAADSRGCAPESSPPGSSARPRRRARGPRGRA